MREDWVEVNYETVVKKVTLTNKKIKQKEYLNNGKIPVIDQGQELIGGYTNDETKILNCELPALVFGDHTKIVKLINFPFASGADGTKVLEPKLHFEPKLLKYFTEVLALKIKDKGYARHYQDIEKSQIPLPPPLEQKAIVAKIEQLFSELDNGVENLKTAQVKLKIYRQAVLKKAFEGEFTREWREKQIDLPTAEELLNIIKQEREAYYLQQLEEWKQAVKEWEKNGGNGKKPHKPKKQKVLDDLSKEDTNDLPKLDKYWEWTTIDNLISFEPNAIKAGPFGSSLKKSFYTDAGYKIYGQEQVISGNPFYGDYYVDEKKYQELSSCKVKPDDILISLVGTVGKVLILPDNAEAGIINPRLIKVELNKKYYLSKMFKYYFESSFLKNIYKIHSHGATMEIITMGIIQTLPYPICSQDEQYQIIQEIESRLSVCDKIEETIKQSLLKSEALRQSILKKAFEGKLLNTQELEAIHTHPDYESAEKLLKRIKQERAK
jgi:type I restriction enzyme S subunit